MDFEGTLILERVAEIDGVDAFFDAIDSDDFEKVVRLRKRAESDSQTIDTVINAN
jgi:hypothetical protein